MLRGVLLLCTVLAAFAAIPVDFCKPGYECKWTYTDIVNSPWEFDFTPLCRNQGADDFSIADGQNHTFHFNVCGLAHEQCLPQWTNTYQFGAAVQSWGDSPACNLTGTPDQYCLEPDSQTRVCCTRPCQVLGVGEPLFKVINTSNPLFGGVSITHQGVPPAHDDPYTCEFNPKTGNQRDRIVTLNLLCDSSLADGELIPLTVEETSNCHYTITAQTKASCGCLRSCENKNCGSDQCKGFCGTMPGGGCPFNYTCTSHQVCCKPDCFGRECGSDGCGGHCGPNAGGCPADRPICLRTQRCATNHPFPPEDNGPVTKTSGGAIAGAFFGGLFVAIALGVAAMFVYKRQRGSYSWGQGSSAPSGTSYSGLGK